MAATDPSRESTRNWTSTQVGLAVAGIIAVLLVMTIGFFLGAGTPGDRAPPVGESISSDRPVPEEVPLIEEPGQSQPTP